MQENRADIYSASCRPFISAVNPVNGHTPPVPVGVVSPPSDFLFGGIFPADSVSSTPSSPSFPSSSNTFRPSLLLDIRVIYPIRKLLPVVSHTTWRTKLSVSKPTSPSVLDDSHLPSPASAWGWPPVSPRSVCPESPRRVTYSTCSRCVRPPNITTLFLARDTRSSGESSVA